MKHPTVHIIDAKDAKIGRVATQAAHILMGKNYPEFQRNVAPKVSVQIVNASAALIDSRKFAEKDYTSYSGYPGGLKHKSMRQVVEKKGYREIFRKAVKGMLPKNRLQAVMLKNLKIEE